MLKSSWQVESFFEVDEVFVEKRKVSMWEYGLFVIGSHLPLSSKGVPEGGGVWEKLIELCKKERCLFVQIETLDYKGVQDTCVSWYKQKYYKKFIPPYTALIDLNQTEEDILANMKQKGRYNIRLAEKKGVVVEQVEKHKGNIKVFFGLVSETTARDRFSGNTQKYYEVFLESLENSQLFFAYHEKQVIAAWIFVGEGEVMTYYYGASSNNKRNLMAPYLLQWRAVQYAKKRGFKLYDFLGVAGDNENNSSLAWVTDFKMKLTPEKTKVSDSYIYVEKKLKFLLITLLKKILKR